MSLRGKLTGMPNAEQALPPDAANPAPPDAARPAPPLPLGTVTPIRIALALIYFHFGFLKFFPDLSAAEMLSTQTIIRLRLGLDAHTALYLLAVFECTIGLLFVLRVSMRIVFPIFLAHMAGTLLPLVLLPELTFKFAPFAPTFEGQYILKNSVVIAAGWTLFLAETRAQAQPAVEDS